MKIKTYFKYVMLLFMAALTMGFTSCSDDDDDNNDPASLVGTWQQYDEESDEYYQITFEADDSIFLNGDFSHDAGYWRVKDNILEMHWDDGSVYKVRFVIKGNKLIFDPGTEDEVVFTRVK